MPKLRVAFVAPSLGILGGQAVQADRLLQAWRNDADVEAWLAASTIHRVSWLAAIVIGGAAVYFVALLVMGVRPGQFKLQAAK